MTAGAKICGLTTPETLDAALDGGAAFVGAVLFAKSPRNIAPAEAATLFERARGRAKIVAVVVDPDDALLDEIARTLKPDLIQLHGHETPEAVAAIAAVESVVARLAIDLVVTRLAQHGVGQKLLDVQQDEHAFVHRANGQKVLGIEVGVQRGHGAQLRWLQREHV